MEKETDHEGVQVSELQIALLHKQVDDGVSVEAFNGKVRA
jgi:hypothetical protein